jgi:pyocin large subunit-like protein
MVGAAVIAQALVRATRIAKWLSDRIKLLPRPRTPHLLPPPRWYAKGFASQAKLDDHFRRHAREWGAGNITKEAYAKRAQSLLGSEVGGDVLGFTSKNGFRFRYNARTNEFATAKPDGTIETLFRPKDGMAYWKEQVSKYGP